MSKNSNKRRKKTIIKVLLKSVVALALCAAIGYVSYLSFFADAGLKKLGYTYKEIQLLHKYEISDQVTTYNQSLLYALNSREFNEKNIEYYLLFDSKMDLTRIVNLLATKYSATQIRDMKTYMTDEDIEALVDWDKVENFTIFKACMQKGYVVSDSVTMANNLPQKSLEFFNSLDQLSQPASYLRYLANGYDDDTICLIYNRLADSNFNNLSNMRYFEDLHALVVSDNFRLENLPRYLMYLDKNISASVLKAISEVNNGKDHSSSTNFSAFYNQKPQDVTNEDVLMLVNKTNRLSATFIPSNLEEINPDYRYGANSLNEIAGEAFVRMAQAVKEDTGVEILVNNGYESYASLDINYSQALIDSYNDASMVDEYLFKAGYDEHQTGLACDIKQKNGDIDDFAKSKAYSWMLENAHRYGFIARYPADKTFITGIQSQPYHFRYVGEAAEIIHQYNWVLEEYCFLFTQQEQ